MSEGSSPLSDMPASMDANNQDAAGTKTESSLPTTAADVKVETPTTPDAEDTTAETPVPTTPNTPISTKRAASPNGENGSPAKKTKGRASPKKVTPARQRKAPNKTPTSARAIAATIEELSTEDRLLLSMKDQGKSWKEINDAWKAATGVEVAKSTLPNRYARLRANITSMSESDQQNLVKAKQLVEEQFEQQKWESISQKMQELGTAEKFSTSVLQKQLQKMGTTKIHTPEDPLDNVEE
ncbi:hypothetical protein SLS56_011797 [Neofusicoccum ribis]|uniref:Myb-like domain-containing protein n=1 Tax=Neofusicoccum ribis TaxID=45134 RepID=A0ABR3SAQ0_9PEZI